MVSWASIILIALVLIFLLIFYPNGLLDKLSITGSIQLRHALPDCPEQCGSMTIYYPFGIGNNCFFDKWFEIDCKADNRSTQPGGESYTPYLKSIGKEVEYMYGNSLRILVPVNFSNYSGISSYDLRGTPFSFSGEVNSLVGVGCNIITFTTDGDYGINSWCGNDCHSDDPHYPDNYLFGCEVALQHNIRTLEPVVVSTVHNEVIMSNNTRYRNNTAGFGFLAYQHWLSDSNWRERSASFEKVPVFLDWDYNVTSHGADNVTTSCETETRWFSVNNSIYKESSFRCSCRSGYEGSPYLSNGCQEWSKNPVVRVLGPCATYLTIVLVLVFLIWLLRKGVKKVTKRRMKKKYFIQNGGLLLQQQISSANGNIEKIKVFSSYELNKATDNFNVDRVLGQGGQGTVYKGMLPNGKIIAVKKSKLVDKANIGQFINEVVILSQINHRNVVKLLGCCLETEVPLLVYEFILNGTLSQLIHKSKEDFALTWEMRLRIGAEIAGALSYMHSAASMPIYHRDMKSTNILLDDRYKAIVSDFGISRSVDIDKTHCTTQVQGTFGYLDPEYFLSSQFTEKSDVYSFGVVLVELLTGHKPIFSNTSQEVKGLALHFVELMDQNQFLEMIDPQILEEGRIDEIIVVCQLAKMCLHMNGKRRPAMKKVAVQLEGILMSWEKHTTDDNYDFIENSVIDLEESSDASSTSTGTWCKGITASSLDELPYVTYP